MTPVARELGANWGILEPLQTASSVMEQVDELKSVLEKHGSPPLTLIGFSWGAWLSLIFAAHHPTMVKKLILIGSGGFEETSAVQMRRTRLNRLSRAEREELESLEEILEKPAAEDKRAAFARFGALYSKADAYDPIDDGPQVIDFRFDIYHSVWNEAAELRRNGALLALARRVRCPVVAIHGDHDPHPAEGVQGPLSAVLEDFLFVLLKNCGHKPWIERQARERFYAVLSEQLRQ